MENPKLQALSTLLEQTSHAHHQAFISTDGTDPEWAIFYAEHLEKPMSELLNTPLTRSRIIYELVRLEETAVINEYPWPKVYAEDLLEKYG